jgi:hypothetical protein
MARHHFWWYRQFAILGVSFSTRLQTSLRNVIRSITTNNALLFFSFSSFDPGAAGRGDGPLRWTWIAHARVTRWGRAVWWWVHARSPPSLLSSSSFVSFAFDANSNQWTVGGHFQLLCWGGETLSAVCDTWRVAQPKGTLKRGGGHAKRRRRRRAI